VPAAKASTFVGLSITGGHGSTHRIGEQVTLCYTSKVNQYIRLASTQVGITTVLRPGVDDGNGECFLGTVTSPTGVDTIRIDAYTANGATFLDYAQISILVVP